VISLSKSILNKNLLTELCFFCGICITLVIFKNAYSLNFSNFLVFIFIQPLEYVHSRHPGKSLQCARMKLHSINKFNYRSFISLSILSLSIKQYLKYSADLYFIIIKRIIIFPRLITHINVRKINLTRILDKIRWQKSKRCV